MKYRPKYCLWAIAVCWSIACSFIVCSAPGARADGLYQVIDLGTLGGSYSAVTAINDLGQAAGDTGFGEGHAFFWSGGTGMVDLGTLGGSWSQATDINNRGQVTGYSALPGDALFHAFVWSRETGMIDLGADKGAHSFGLAINDAGQVAGSQIDLSGYHAFVWSEASGRIPLGDLGGGQSYASAINGSGQVTGWSYVDSYRFHAFVWSAAGGMADIDPYDGMESVGHDINEAGEVAGRSDFGGFFYRAMYWSPSGGMVDLGTLGGFYSDAYDINERGEIAGSADTADGRTHAYFWSAAGGIQSTGPKSGRFGLGFGLNDAGLTVCSSPTRAFFWSREEGARMIYTLGGLYNEARVISAGGHAGGWSLLKDGLTRHAFITNYRPEGDPLHVSCAEGSPVTFTLTGSDREGDALEFLVNSQPVRGTLSGDAPNLVYTPRPGYRGADAFTFRVRDSLGGLSRTVRVVVGVE